SRGCTSIQEKLQDLTRRPTMCELTSSIKNSPPYPIFYIHKMIYYLKTLTHDHLLDKKSNIEMNVARKTTNVLFSTHKNGVATITLNRPKAINSLTLDMLQPNQDKLNEWKTDEHVQLIIIQGEGEKGF